MKNKTGYGSRFVGAVLPVFTVVFLYLFLTPIDSILSNQQFLSVSPRMVWPVLLLISLAVSLAVTAGVSLFKGKAYRIIILLISGVLLASFIQLLFFNSNLAVLDGTVPDWESMKSETLINSLVWIVLVFLPLIISLFLKTDSSKRVIAFVISLAILCSQTVSLASLLLMNESKEQYAESYALNGAEQYTVSSGENVIVFSLDFLSKDYFDEILERYPETAEELKDFEYFSNACGNYNFTFPSLINMFTGRAFTGDELSEDYIRNAWNSDTANTFYDLLHEKGYTVNLYSDIEYIGGLDGKIAGKTDNLEIGKKSVTGKMYNRLIRVSCYRLLPMVLKKHALVSTSGDVVSTFAINEEVEFTGELSANKEYESMHLETDFLSELRQKGLTLADDRNIFSWTHLFGAHLPCMSDEYCEPVETETNHVTQARGYLYAVSQYLEEMKKDGTYDDSVIIITADHGMDYEPDVSLFVPILIKSAGQKQDQMTVNEAPVTQTEIMPTIVSLLKGDTAKFGKTLYDFTAGEARERTLRRLDVVDGYPGTEWFNKPGSGKYNVFKEYTFTGDQDTLDGMLENDDCKIVPLADSFY